MIVFNVSCSNDHTFEGWFPDGASFDAQVSEGSVVCPVCGDTEVRKALSAPRLGGMSKGRDEAVPNAASAPDGPGGDKLREYMSALNEIKSHIEQNSDYVGNRFPEEARKIHYGETDARAIHGEASADEARALKDEGVEFYSIPWPKSDA